MTKRARRRVLLPLWFMCGALASAAFIFPPHLILLWSLWP